MALRLARCSRHLAGTLDEYAVPVRPWRARQARQPAVRRFPHVAMADRPRLRPMLFENFESRPPWLSFTLPRR